MSHKLTFNVSDAAFDAICADAEAANVTPAKIVSAMLERQFGSNGATKVADMTQDQWQAFIAATAGSIPDRTFFRREPK